MVAKKVAKMVDRMVAHLDEKSAASKVGPWVDWRVLC
jgi:hypothetical protein